MITEPRLEKALAFLSETDESNAEANANVKYLDRLLKRKKALHITGNSEDKSISAKEQSYYASDTYKSAVDELFEAVTLIQTNKIEKFPIIMVGTSYWEGLIEWIKEVLLEKNQAISPEDMDLIHLVDTPEEVTEILDAFYKQYQLSPNF